MSHIPIQTVDGVRLGVGYEVFFVRRDFDDEVRDQIALPQRGMVLLRLQDGSEVRWYPSNKSDVAPGVFRHFRNARNAAAALNARDARHLQREIKDRTEELVRFRAACRKRGV
ncbi:MAG: hypothetical protein KIS92_01050 [Planctomycetota bacterium]|nr:hypothetical protein [Planctomycetota bacterium]